MIKSHLKKYTHLALAIILFLSLSFGSNVQAEGSEVQSTVSNLHMRSGPGLAYPIIASLQMGDRMLVLDQQSDWIKVRKGSAEGWVASWYTKQVGDQKEQAGNQFVVSKVDRLNVRSQASTDAAVLTKLSAGDQAKLLRDHGNWVEISFNQVQGFVAKEYITIQQNDTKHVTTQASSGNQFEVSVDSLNVRSKADLSAKKVGTISKGERFKVLDKQHNWVKIQLSEKESGWVYSFYGNFTSSAATSTTSEKPEEVQVSKPLESKTIFIVSNGTNIRSNPTTSSEVVYRADAGESFTTNGQSGEWYEIKTPDGSSGFVANWVVSSDATEEETVKQEKEDRKKGTLKGLSIVIDPGHGGNDHGTTGARGTDEKGITLSTSEMLASKLRAAGADVVMTRDSDVYVDLRKRVAIGHQLAADAFISIHYDATESSAINGFTTYYMHGYQKGLAESVHESLGNKISLRDRGAQPGNYLVLRENRQQAILIELGFLSNLSEERAVTTEQFREQATLGIYNGVVNYFDDQLN